MIQIGLNLGIFTNLVKADSAKTADEVAKDTGADPQLMSTYYQTLALPDLSSRMNRANSSILQYDQRRPRSWPAPVSGD